MFAYVVLDSRLDRASCVSKVNTSDNNTVLITSKVKSDLERVVIDESGRECLRLLLKVETKSAFKHFQS